MVVNGIGAVATGEYGAGRSGCEVCRGRVDHGAADSGAGFHDGGRNGISFAWKKKWNASRSAGHGRSACADRGMPVQHGGVWRSKALRVALTACRRKLKRFTCVSEGEKYDIQERWNEYVDGAGQEGRAFRAETRLC